MKKIRFRIEGMTCSACSNGLEKYLNKQPKILDATVNLVLQEASIQYEDDLTIDELENFIKEAGFQSLGEPKDIDLIQQSKLEKKRYLIFSSLTILIFYISMSHMLKLPILPILEQEKNPVSYGITLFFLTIPFLYFGKDIFQKGWKNLLHQTPNMDTLVSISVLSSFIYSSISLIGIISGQLTESSHLYFESVAMIIFFMKLGRYLDSSSKNKTLEAIQELIQMTPEFAIRKTGEKEEKITIDEVKVEDILIAKPGMKIAVDGIITEGTTHLEEAFITGESIPIKKKKGDSVVAGSLNYDGVIEYQAKRIGRDSTISEIVHFVVDATNTKAPISKVADKISWYFVPTIFLLAIVTFISYLLLKYPFSEALDAFLTILVVACPCALGLATPIAMVVSIGFCAKNGILVKSSEILEIAHKVDTIVFDKTGTLTIGNLEIDQIIHSKSYHKKEILQLVASIEQNSTHPISKPFLQYAKKNKLSLFKTSNFQNLEGIGITATIDNQVFYLGNAKLFSRLKMENPYSKEEIKFSQSGCSILYIIKEKEVIALIGVKDKVRPDAKFVIQKLKEMKKEIMMLTGDNEIVGKRIANEIGIDSVIANMLPTEKSQVISDLKEAGKTVMMIGDGINDAPSLALADIGVSVQGATEIANNAADIIFTKNKLTSILDFVIISKKTLTNIKQNLFWAFFYNSCMIPIAIGVLKPFGIRINPMFASIAMIASSLTVIGNALRLKNIKLERI